MANEVPISVTFLGFVLLFVGVGIYSGTRKQSTTEDYLVASRSINPWLAGLSAVATGNSGFMFIGLIGFTYQVGLSAMWIMVGWIFGDYLAWLWIHQRLRQVSEETDAHTIPAFLGQGDRWIQAVSALVTLAFLGSYAAAQLQAGSKALNVLFDWDYSIGIIFGAVIVAVYCVSGGIRASIWVGSVQSMLMMGSMVLLLTVAVIASGGPATLWTQLREIDPTLIAVFPSDLQFGFLPFLVGWLVAGFGVIGQPHITIRLMTIDSPENVGSARNIYVLFYTMFAAAAIGVGLTARVLMPELMTGSDTELALPQLAEQLLPGFLVGLVLAGLFSAIISTADSQVLSCSASLTQDIFPQAARSYTLAKAGTLTVTAIILLIALVVSDNVFTLVTFAWSALASGLAPLMLVRVLGRPASAPVGILMMVVGIAVALTWRLGLGWSEGIYEALPGMAASALVYLVAQLFAPTSEEAEV
jgi:sodium/proline symporter